MWVTCRQKCGSAGSGNQQGSDLLVLGTGQYDNLRLSPEAAEFFARKGCEVHNPSSNHDRQMRRSSARRSSACARRATFVCYALPSDSPKFLEKILDGLAFGNPFARGLLARCLFAGSLQDNRGVGQPYHGDADFIGDDEIARMDR